MAVLPPPDGAGGGGGRYGNFVINPHGTFDFGNILVGQQSTQTFTITNNGTGLLILNSIQLTGNSVWTLSGLPAFPKFLNPGQHVDVTVKFAPGAVQPYTNTLQVAYDNGLFDFTYNGPLTGAGVGIASAQFDPTFVTFPNTQIKKSSVADVTLKNVGALPFDVTNASVADTTNFDVLGHPPYPTTLNPGDVVTFNLGFHPQVVGILQTTLTVNTTGGDLTCQLSGLALNVLSVDVLVQNVRDILFGGGYSVPSLQKLVVTDYNSEEDGQVVFNGCLWNSPGKEKTLFNVFFYHEDFGLATLSLIIKVLRPYNSNPDNYDEETYTVNLGSQNADGLSRCAIVNTNITGEIIFMTLLRAANSGAVVIQSIMPDFEGQGEKVKDV